MPERVSGSDDFPTNGLHGIFAKLGDLGISESGIIDVYDTGCADFYDAFMEDYVADIPIFERMIDDGSPAILDLACGSGRISVALAKLGYRVDGLDLSQSMLNLAAERLARPNSGVGTGNIRLIKGDMTSFNLGTFYDLIILGITSISLLIEEAQRRSLFECVCRHLSPGGKFVFDVLDLEDHKWKQFDNIHDVWSYQNDAGTDFGIVGQRFYPNERVFILNIYRETIDWAGETNRVLARSVKAWLSVQQLEEELARSGLTIFETFVTERQRYFVVTAEAKDEL